MRAGAEQEGEVFNGLQQYTYLTLTSVSKNLSRIWKKLDRLGRQEVGSWGDAHSKDL